MDKKVQSEVNNNIFVYLDLRIGDEKAGRVIIELFKNIVPKTVANFKALCTGEFATAENKLHFKGSSFNRVLPQFLVQGGEIQNVTSIYGGAFDDENFTLLHDVDGTVGMANSGPNTNISQFYVTTVPCPHLDGLNVVFGYVRKGLNVIKEMAAVPRNDEDKPLIDCIIENCGEIKPGDDFNLNENDETTDIYPPWPDDFEKFEDFNVEDIVSAIKNSGNYFYYKKNYVDSERKYKKVLRYIDWINRTKYKHNCNFVNNIKMQTLLNLAAVRLNRQKYRDVVDICTQVLEVDPKHGKALYRRGQARLKLKDYDKALGDLQLATLQHPNDAKIMQDYLMAKKFRQIYLEEERRICTKMFQQQK